MLSGNVAGVIGVPFRFRPMPRPLPAISPVELPMGDRIVFMAKVEIPVRLDAGLQFIQFYIVNGLDNVAIIGLSEERFMHET